MKSLLLTTAVAIGISASMALTTTDAYSAPLNESFTCYDTGGQRFASRREAAASRIESDPVEHINIAVRDNHRGGFTLYVEHVTASGGTINRFEQYPNARVKQWPNRVEWTGTYDRNRSVRMVGVLQYERKGYRSYTETRFDHGRAAWTSVSRCEPNSEGAD